MLYSIDYYYQKSIESTGIASMECRMRACTFSSFLCQIKYWPEVENYGDYIRKCYGIAKDVPFDDLRHQYISLKFRNVYTLKKLLQKVKAVHNELNRINLNDESMGYTPITHVQEQLSRLEDEIHTEIDSKKFW